MSLDILSAAASEEITVLIDVLHRTGQRLEELTSGQVDTVADHEGRAFMLRHAQDVLRDREAMTQLAILNALPAQVAMLDRQGVIVGVNDAWRRLAGANAMQGPEFGVGVDYLRACDKAAGPDALEAHRVAVGIRSVLEGDEKLFSMQYPCHSPPRRRWFSVTVAPLSDDGLGGVVVMHTDITQHETAVQEHVATRRLLNNIVENIPTAVQLKSVQNGFRIQLWNKAAEAMYGLPRNLAIGRNVRELWPGAAGDRMHAADLALLADGGVQDFPARTVVKYDGKTLQAHMRKVALLDENGDATHLLVIADDISDQLAARLRIAHLNRVRAVLSGINALIVRVQRPEELFTQACQVAVGAGGFRMVWIAIAEPGSRDFSVAASEGIDEDLLTAINSRLHTSASGRSEGVLVAQMLQKPEALVFNDLRRDAQHGFGKKHLVAGILSVAVLPLIVSGETIGLLALCAKEAEFFLAEEMKLLTELAGDIAFAMEHIDRKQRLEYLAYYDALTGLANRSLFLERLAQHMRSAVVTGARLALFLVDLERFKDINDSLGRPAGDALLRQVADWLKHNAGEAPLLSRIGGDHFAVLLPDIRPAGNLQHLLEHTISAFVHHPFRLNDAIFRVAAKAGAAIFPVDGLDAETLLRNAEAALKKAKAGGTQYLFYTQGMHERVAGRLTLENQLRDALEREEFVLHYQPKISAAGGRLTGAEALIRWMDPRSGLVPPGRFIPVLEDTGLIHEVGRWALRQAVADHLAWCAAGHYAPRIAVNVSALQLRHRDFIDEVTQAIGVDPLAAAGLELEITESVVMGDVKHGVSSLQAIRAMGVTVAIDDFGTGFSSLSYLSRLPVDALKIDQSFVADMTAGPQGLALVRTIIDLAHSLKLKVVAEGVETEEQSRLLRVLGCDELQGFLFSKALPREQFETLFLAGAPR